MNRVCCFVFLMLVSQVRLNAQYNFAILPESSNRCSVQDLDYHLLPDSASACRGNVVGYSAYGDSLEYYHYIWQITGGTPLSFSSDSTSVEIEWGDGAEGWIVLTRTRGQRMAAKTLHINLVDKPNVASYSSPEYSVTIDGKKVVNVCTGYNVVFTDASGSDDAPITDYYWECVGEISNGPVFEFTPPYDDSYTIVHRVYNVCGCYDEETIEVRALGACPFDMTCYGTACANSTQTYTLTSVDCSEYIWAVENGTILAGQGGPQIMVHWGDPDCGYGVLTLDGSSCYCECKGRKSIRVPIISNRVVIDGPDTVCVGSEQFFSVPLFGSTGYTWSVEPPGAVIYPSSLPSESHIRFNQIGAYTVKVDYTCPFLECVGSGDDLTVVVLDSLRTMPRSAKVCRGDVFSCTTDSHLPVQWTLLKGNQTVFDTIGEFFRYRFVDEGNYRIYARSGSHCNTAECPVSVAGHPAVPIIVSYPMNACPLDVVPLAGISASRDHYIEWKSAYGGTIPEQIEGDSVSIGFGDTIATILATQIDRTTGCRSDSVVIKIKEFELDTMPCRFLRLCQGQTKHLEVADQSADGVLYMWWVEYPEFASIIGDNTGNGIDIIANYYDIDLPYEVNLFLKRKSCLGETVNVIRLRIGELDPPSIIGPDEVCQNNSEVYMIDQYYTEMANADECQWNGGGSSTGQYHFANFSESGQNTVSLHYVSQYGCQAVNIQKSVTVVPQIWAYLDTLSIPGQICMQFDDIVNGNVSYSWNNGMTGQCVPYIQGQHYQCTARIVDHPCDVVAALGSSSHYVPCRHHTIIEEQNLRSAVTCFNKVIFFRDNIPESVTSLNITCNGHTKKYDFPSDEHQITAKIDSLGEYVATMEWKSNDTCYMAKSRGRVSTVPNIIVKYDCADSLIIYDSSLYRSALMPSPRNVIVRKGGGLIFAKQMTGNARRTAMSIRTLRDGEVLNVLLQIGTCIDTTKYMFHYKPHQLSINARRKMCNQTPFQFSASAAGTGLTYQWSFSDNSYNYGQTTWHTFGNNTITSSCKMIAFDFQGCKDSAIVNIKNKNNIFCHGENEIKKIFWDHNNYPVCTGTPLKLVYRENYGGSRVDTNQLLWMPQNTNCFTDSIFVTAAGSYFVFATDTSYLCKGSSRAVISFLNTPKARIGYRNKYCQNETVNLQGNTGSQYAYEWTITSPTSVVTQYNTADIAFTVRETGLWKARLRVSAPPELGGCTSADSITFSVYPPPVAPTIVFDGNKCISEGPVDLACDEEISLIWSNGTSGVTTRYYYDGLASAYYIDQQTGCKSLPTQILIPQAPRMDAVLTGCYEICNDDQPYMNVLSVGADVNWWQWQKEYLYISQGQTFPASLPVTPNSTFFMTASYGADCESESNGLTIYGRDCSEEEHERLLGVELEDVTIKMEGCKIKGTFTFRFINDSELDFTMNRILFYPDQTNYTMSTFPVFVPAQGSSALVDLEITFSDFSQPIIYIVFADGVYKLGQISFNLLEWLEQQNVHSGCFFGTNVSITPNVNYGTQGQTVFFDFTCQPSVPDVYMLWSDEGEVLNYNYDALNNEISSLLYFDYGKFSQLLYADSCIHLHLLVCDKEGLCIADTCIGVGRLADYILPPEYQPKSCSYGDISSEALPESRYLVYPNPTSGEVIVLNKESWTEAADIAGITVYSIDGREVLNVSGVSRLNVVMFAQAAYIIKIVSADGKTEFVKLIKK